MSCFQLLYDLTLFFSNVDCGYYVSTVANIFQLSCGIASSLVSNWISFVAWYVVTYRQKFDVLGNLHLIIPSCAIPGLVDAIMYAVSRIPQDKFNEDLEDVSVLGVYYYIRLISIGFNFLFCLATVYMIYQMSPQKGMKSIEVLALRTVAIRMIYYPIVQAIGRSGYAWYEAEYGADIDNNYSDSNKFACLMFVTIITPMTPVGYLIIFLTMQPQAYIHFIALMTCQDAADLEKNKMQQEVGPRSFSIDDVYDWFADDSSSRQVTGSMVQSVGPGQRSSHQDWARPSSMVEMGIKSALLPDNAELQLAVQRGSITSYTEKASTVSSDYSVENVLHSRNTDSQNNL